MDTIASKHICLDKRTLLFPPDIEQAFLLDQLPSKQAFFKTSLVVFFFLNLFLQYVNFEAWVLTPSLILAVLPAMMLCTKCRLYEKQIDLLSCLAIFITCAALLSIIILLPDTFSNFSIYLFLLISTGVLFKIRYLYVALTGLFLTISFGVCLTVFTTVEPARVFINTGFVFFASIIGVAAAYTIEYYNRMFFLKSFVLEQTLTDTLKKERRLNDELVRANKSLEIEIRAHTEAESQLRESEEKYRNLVTSIPDGIFIVQHQKIVFLNPSMEGLSGYLSDELLGKDADSFFMRTPTSREEKEDYDVFVRKDGQSVYIEKSYVEIVYNSEPALLFSVRNITQRVFANQKQKQLEKELGRAKKMEAFGILAGGVAHDLNNVLSGLMSAPDAMLADLPNGSNLAVHANIIKESGKKAFNIADELLTMVRGSAKALSPVRLNDVIEDYFLSPEYADLVALYPDVTIQKEMPEDLPIFNASDIHMRKIVMNLISNAMEAAGMAKGEVWILTGVEVFSNRQIQGYEKINDGRYIKFSVENTGKGISKEDIDHIFEPFYSKKVLGRSGTGLGLSVVWSAVHDHNGYIHVCSDDKTTSFSLYFPISDATQDSVEIPAKVYTIDDYRGNKEKILVVDDLPEQQKIAVNILKRLGYQVWTASSGEQAIQYVRKNPVDLVVLDMVMDPGLNGRQTFQELVLIDPEIKAIITSGYSYDDDVKAVQKLGAGQFVKKPYSLESLGVAIKNEFSDREL